MVLVLALAAALWGFGAAIKAPVNARLLMVGLLYLGVLAVQIAMPEGHPLREMTGGSAGEWLVLGGLGLAVWAYAKGLTSLKKHVRPENKPRQSVRSSSVELERNARHIVLREIGGPGQKRLKNARVLVIGAGGLGAPALQYLAAAGVGTIGVIDDDVVENSNLQRQVIHTDARIGMPKVFSAEQAMTAQNPFVTVRPYHRRLTADIAADLFADYDLILDGTDDVATRYLVNETAVAAKLPLPAYDQCLKASQTAADLGRDKPVGRSDQPVRSGAWRPLLSLRLPRTRRRRSRAQLRRRRRPRPLTRRHGGHDGGRGCQAAFRCGPAVAWSFAHIRCPLCGNPRNQRQAT